MSGLDEDLVRILLLLAQRSPRPQPKIVAMLNDLAVSQPRLVYFWDILELEFITQPLGGRQMRVTFDADPFAHIRGAFTMTWEPDAREPYDVEAEAVEIPPDTDTKELGRG